MEYFQIIYCTKKSLGIWLFVSTIPVDTDSNGICLERQTTENQTQTFHNLFTQINSHPIKFPADRHG